MSDHIEHACTNCGSLLHHEDVCPRELSTATRGSEPPAGAAKLCPTCGKGHGGNDYCSDAFHQFDFAPGAATPPPQSQENQRVETPAAEPAETNANAIGSCAGSSPASLSPQPQGGTGTPEVDAAIVYCDLMTPEDSPVQYADMVPVDLARTLAHERNEARAALTAAQVSVSSWQSTAESLRAEVEALRKDAEVNREIIGRQARRIRELLTRLGEPCAPHINPPSKN